MRLKVFALVAVIGLLTVTLSAAFAVDLSPRGWTSYNERVSFSTSVDGGLKFSLPVYPRNVGYVYRDVGGIDLTGSWLIVTLRVETTGSPTFVWDTSMNECPSPAKIRPVIGRYWQGHTKKIPFAERWWPRDAYAYTLAPGSVTIMAPLFDDTQWVGELPQSTFFAGLTDVDFVGVSLGGGCFYAHGVGVQGGTVNVVITDWHVE